MEERLQEAGVQPVTRSSHGKRAETIVRYAEENAADLMILSSHKVDRDHPALGWGRSATASRSWRGARCCW